MSRRPPAALVIPAAGSGSRVGATVNKLLLDLAGEPLLLRTLRQAAAAEFAQVVLVTRPDERAPMASLAARVGLGVTFADGGATRQDSVASGLRTLAEEIRLVAVHDGARPLVEPDLFTASLDSAWERGSGVVALPVVDTLKLVEDGRAAGSVDRERVWAMQTPQSFRRELLERAVAHAQATGFIGTDETSLVEHLGEPVYLVPGSARNLKVTRPEDFLVATALLQEHEQETGKRTMRIGYGYDVHRLVEGRQLVLGGVTIDSPVGLLGHSDADALVHAICDALLGAIGEGDIGRHFPDTDPAYKDADSMVLLRRVFELVAAAGFAIGNVDATVIAQRPKLAPYIPEMRVVLAEAMATSPGQVNVKATTHEELDDLGQGLGIAAHAVALLVPRG